MDTTGGKAEPFTGKIEPAKSVGSGSDWGVSGKAVGKTQSEGHNEVKLAGAMPPKLGK